MEKVFAGVLILILAACSSAQATSSYTLSTASIPPPIETKAPTPTDTPVFAPTLMIPTLQAGSPVKLTTIRMLDAENGWGVQTATDLRPGFQGDPFLRPQEGYILHTTDGGKSWQNATPPTGAYSPSGFFALDADTAWASDNVPCCIFVTAARLWRTADGGKTWQAGQPFTFETGRFNQIYLPVAIQFVDRNTGWLMAAPETGMDDRLRPFLFHTRDGGETWTGTTENFENCWNGGLAFINSTTGWYGTSCISGGKVMRPFKDLFAEGGWTIRHTTDGGYSFLPDTVIPLPSELQKQQLTNPEVDCGERRVIAFTAEVVGVEWECRVYSAMGSYDRYSYFSLTTDSGLTWKTSVATGNEYFVDPKTGWRLLAPGQLQQTTDGGLSWPAIKTVTWENVQFDFIDDLEGWAIASSGNAQALLHTKDGGKTWIEIKPIIGP